jgi:hypothetical protein
MNWKEGYKQYCSNKCSSNSELTKNKLKIVFRKSGELITIPKLMNMLKKLKKPH